MNFFKFPCLLLIFFLLISNNTFVFAQSLTVVRTGNGIFLEKQGSFGSGSAYRLGPNAALILSNSIKKAIEWYDLNQIHRKNFIKEINRFRVMEKSEYEFHGYVEEFTKNAKVMFSGYPDDKVKCTIEIDSFIEGYVDTFISLDSKKEIQDFLKILQGKSVNPDIDNIFKN